jgi:hypothetical protein
MAVSYYAEWQRLNSGSAWRYLDSGSEEQNNVDQVDIYSQGHSKRYSWRARAFSHHVFDHYWFYREGWVPASGWLVEEVLFLENALMP